MPLAHLGHWYVGGPVFLSPVIAIWVLMKVLAWRDRRRGVTRHESRVEVALADEVARITIRGPLDWPALTDLENELDDLRGQAALIDVDLSATSEIPKRSAERLAELIDLAELGAAVEVRGSVMHPAGRPDG